MKKSSILLIAILASVVLVVVSAVYSYGMAITKAYGAEQTVCDTAIKDEQAALQAAFDNQNPETEKALQDAVKAMEAACPQGPSQ